MSKFLCQSRIHHEFCKTHEICGLVQRIVQEVLESEMEDLLQASKHERSDGRTGYRSGYYPRGLATRVGKIELQVPQDRQGLLVSCSAT